MELTSKIVIKATAEEAQKKKKKAFVKIQKLFLKRNVQVPNQSAGWMFMGSARMCPPK